MNAPHITLLPDGGGRISREGVEVLAGRDTPRVMRLQDEVREKRAVAEAESFLKIVARGAER